ncbi:MAG: endonuclease/exonuclease/phosphatase family protein [Verrucomicrobiota bacterium]|nr:endonuclease/exonuclease/phosphatase family protein [Verrucomicrobiota bacterium]
MRIATYNVENLFSRVHAMNSDDPDQTSVVLAAVAELQALIAHEIYTVADKARMLEILKKHKATGTGGPFFLQETRRRLYSNGKIVADGREDWIGSIEWRRDLIQGPAIENTGRIINEIKADVLCLVEVESRPVLRRFNDTILKDGPYPHAILIDGNDERGIDVGLLSRRPVTDMRSHTDDLDPVTKWPVFSRDCAEFEIDIPGTRHLWMLVNHFKSRGYGSKASNDAKRKRQSETVAAILRRFDLQKQWVIVAGDLNELSSSVSLAPLLQREGLRNACAKCLTTPIAGRIATRHPEQERADRLPARLRSALAAFARGGNRAARGLGEREKDAGKISAAQHCHGREQLRERPRRGLGGF